MPQNARERYDPLVLAPAVIAATCAEGLPAGAPRTHSTAALGDGSGPAGVTLYKIGPAGTNATFGQSADGGESRAGSTVTVARDEKATCVETWRTTDLTAVSTKTVTEVGASVGTKLREVVRQTGPDGWGFADVAT